MNTLKFLIISFMLAISGVATADECPLCETRDLEEVKKLLASGVDVNSTNSFGEPALISQAQWDDPEIIQALLDAGANLNLTDNYKRTALMYASGINVLYSLEAIEKVQENALSGTEKLVQIMTEGLKDRKIKYNNILKLLLAAGAKPDIKDREGYTALMYAVYVNDTEAMKLLLDGGASVDIKNDDGYTALIISVHRESSAESANILIQNNADVNVTDNYGDTPLMHAAEAGKAQIAKLLIKHDADVHATNADGWTALDIAEEVGDRGVARILRKAGAD